MNKDRDDKKLDEKDSMIKYNWTAIPLKASFSYNFLWSSYAIYNNISSMTIKIIQESHYRDNDKTKISTKYLWWRRNNFGILCQQMALMIKSTKTSLSPKYYTLFQLFPIFRKLKNNSKLLLTKIIVKNSLLINTNAIFFSIRLGFLKQGNIRLS